MPLSLVRRKGSENWYVRGTVRGQALFESAGTSDRALALQVCEKRQAELWQRSVFGAEAVATFTQAAESYLVSEPRAFTTRRALRKLLVHFRGRKLSEISQESLDRAYRAILGASVTAATKVRHVRTPLVAVLEHASRRGWCARPNFERPSIAKTRTSFLLPEQVVALIENASPHARALFTFQAGCGTRPSEAFELHWVNVDLAGARVVVTQKQGDQRYIDLPPVVLYALIALPHREGPVFQPKRRQLKDASGNVLPLGYATGERSSGQAEKAFATAARKAGLPGHWRLWNDKRGKPQKQWVSEIPFYALRHTWASWHYCRFKDLRRTMEDGGWGTVDMVMHYAKLVPDVYRFQIEDWLAGRPLKVTKSEQLAVKIVNS
jgi:integrase